MKYHHIRVAAVVVAVVALSVVALSGFHTDANAAINAAGHIVSHGVNLDHVIAPVAALAAVDIKKLRQTRADSATKGKAALDRLNALLARENPTDEEKAEIESLEAEVTRCEEQVTALDSQIAAEDRKVRRANLFNASTAMRLPALANTSSEPNPETTGGFRNLAEFAVAVRNQVTGMGSDPRLAAAAADFHQNQGGAGEGHLVPAEYRQQIWELVFNDSGILALCNPEPTNSNAIKIPKDETTPWGASGVQAAWRSEGLAMVASKAALTGTLLELNELYAFVLATNELLEDAPRLNSRLTMQAARAIRFKAADAVVSADGNGKPKGFMKSACLVTVAKDSGQAAATITVNNVLSMYSRLLAVGGNPVWLANRDTLPQLGQLTIGNVPAWLPNNQPLAGAPEGGTFMGRPLIFNEHMETLGTVGDLVVADLSGYALATKIGGGIDFAASIHLYFDQGLQAFRWTFRVGGQPYLSAPVAPNKGSNTKSHFVALATRA